MHFKSQIATTREQSGRLLALGLKPETADMYLEKCRLPEAGDYYLHALTKDINPEQWFSARMNRDIVPAWSLSRLLELLPQYIDEEEGVQLMIEPLLIVYYDTQYKGHHHFTTNPNIFENCISMISWLIANGHFNKEYLK
jgi:hypothetical protein